MKKFKKTLSLTLAGTLMAATVLTGCGTEKKEADNDGTVTIRMSWWGNDERHQATLNAIEAFEKEYPNIKVKAEYSGWDGMVEKMTTQIAGGTEADLMQINYDWYNTYSKDGNGFADLNEYKDIIDLSGYSEETLQAAMINGKLNGIPHGENSSAIGINRTKYEEFGVNPDELKTWDDYKKAAEKFPEGYYPLMFSGFSNIMVVLTQKYGVAFLDNDGNINYTEDQLIEGMNWYREMVDAGVTPDAKKIIETIGSAHPSTVKEFIDGEYDGFIDWTGGMASYSNALAENGMELEIPTYPTLEEGQDAGVIKKPTMLFSISKHSKHPKEAAQLLNFLLNEEEGVKAMGTTRGLPVNKNAVKILEDAGLIDDTSRMANDFVQNTKGVMESPYMEMSQVSEAYTSAFEKFTMGQTDAETAAKEIIANVEAAIKEIKAQ